MTVPAPVGPLPSGSGPVPHLRLQARAVIPRTYLTARERQTLLLAANGHTNRSIARQLGIAEETVKTAMARLRRKLRAADRAHAVAVALRLGLIAMDDITVPEGANSGYRDTA